MNFFEEILSIIERFGPLLLQGAWVTTYIAITGTVIGFVIGLLCGVVRTIPMENAGLLKRVVMKIVNVVISVYVEVFRGTPMMVQAVVMFYGYVALTSNTPDRILAGIIIVSINTGAYMAEIVRGGILSVDKGQFEAAHAIGMNHTKTMVFVVIPQVIRNILPATGNEFVINIKDTSVLNVISVTELFFQTGVVTTSTYMYFQGYLVTSVIYLFLTFTITRLLRIGERKLSAPKNFKLHTIGGNDDLISVPGGGK